MWLVGLAVLAGGAAWIIASLKGESKAETSPPPAKVMEHPSPQLLAGMRDEYRRKVVEPAKVNWDPNVYLTADFVPSTGDQVIRFDFSKLNLADANKLAAKTPAEAAGYKVRITMPRG